MPNVPIKDIQVPQDRQRKDLQSKTLGDLKESIRTKGLFHPITLRQEDGNLFLHLGERRFRAVQELCDEGTSIQYNGQEVQLGYVPAVTLSEMDEIEREEAELEENICREDLTWKERANAVARLHSLREKQRGTQTQTDTASELAARRGQELSQAHHKEVMRSRLVAQMKDHPEVQGAKSLWDGFRAATKIMKQEFEQNREAPKVRSPHICVNMDCRTSLASMPSGQFDCIIADPPYGIGANTFGDYASQGHQYDDSAEYGLEVSSVIIREGFRVAQEQAHLYLFCDIEHFLFLREEARSVGWKPWRTPLVWFKSSQGHLSIPDYGPRRTYELILYLNKGNKPVRKTEFDAITGHPPEKERDHAAEKPVGLYKHLLSTSCVMHDVVLDPCCGAGTIFQAAKELHLVATGIELDEEYYKIAKSKAEHS